MWTPTTRRQQRRDHLRYGSDLSDAEWEILSPFMAPPAKTGRPREWSMREIVQWDILPDAGGLPVAAGAERPAAVGDDLPLVRRLARRRAL